MSSPTGTAVHYDGASPCITHYRDDGGSLHSYKYYLSRRTVFEMLKDRGYDVPDSELSRSLSEFRAEFGNDPDLQLLRICVPLLKNPSKKIMVIFCGTDEIRKASICGILCQIMNKESLQGLMLILQSKMNSFARKEVEKSPFKVEIFQMADLFVNITKHILQPKLVLLSAEEKKLLLKKYMIEDKQLPQMLETDAIVRYYGLKKGQVVKVTYSGGGVADSLETYRCVM